MSYIIVVFRSRTETLNFANLLKANRISAMIISTPKEVSQACGISVKFYSEYLNKARELLRLRKFYTYNGIYKVTEQNARRVVEKIG